MKAIISVFTKIESVMTKSCGFLISSLFSILFLASFTAFAQSDKLETDKGFEASIAGYDADVRQAILLDSQHPSVLTQLQQSQTQSIRSFHKMISRIRTKKQEWFYTVT